MKEKKIIKINDFDLSLYSFVSINKNNKENVFLQKFWNCWLGYEVKEKNIKALIYNFLILDKNDIDKWFFNRASVIYNQEVDFNKFILEYNRLETEGNRQFQYIWYQKNSAFTFSWLFIPSFYNDKWLNYINNLNLKLYKTNLCYLFWWWKLNLKKLNENKNNYNLEFNLNKEDINFQWSLLNLNEIIFQIKFFQKLFEIYEKLYNEYLEKKEKYNQEKEKLKKMEKERRKEIEKVIKPKEPNIKQIKIMEEYFSYFLDDLEKLLDEEKIIISNNLYLNEEELKNFDKDTQKIYLSAYFQKLSKYFKEELEKRIIKDLIEEKPKDFLELVYTLKELWTSYNINEFLEELKKNKNIKFFENNYTEKLNKIIKKIEKNINGKEIINYDLNEKIENKIEYANKVYLPEYKFKKLGDFLFDNLNEKKKFLDFYEKNKSNFKNEDDYILRYFMYKWFFNRILKNKDIVIKKWLKFEDLFILIKWTKNYLNYYKELETLIEKKELNITSVNENILSKLEKEQIEFIEKFKNEKIDYDFYNQKYLTFEDYVKQLEYEYITITYLWFSWYFNIVMDFIKWAKNNYIWVWPWRWSAWWVLVSFCLDIIDVNPKRYWLLFERMLHLYKSKWDFPDIDVDFESEWREKVFKYVQKKYSDKNVAHVWSIWETRVKSEFKTLTKNSWIWFSMINNITKSLFTDDEKFNRKRLDQILDFYEKGIDLEDVDSNTKEMLVQYKNKLYNAFKMLKTFLWTPSDIGIHACWIIISSVEIETLSACRFQPDTILKIERFDKKEAEKYWFIKFDFLWLSNMSIIKQTIKSILWNHEDIRKKYWIKIEKFSNEEWENLDWMKMYYDILDSIGSPKWTEKHEKEKKVFEEIFSIWLTWWVFQFESEGMKSNLRSVMPENILELSDINAMFRPWPLANIPIYIETKFWKTRDIFPKEFITELLKKYDSKLVFKTINFFENIINDVTLKTKNLLVYQEQIMMFFYKMWLPYDKADKIRKILSKIKKWMYTLDDLKPYLQSAREEIKKKWLILDVFERYLENIIMPFSEYAFNFSHAFAYCIVWYISWYLKYYYPEEFYASLLKYKEDIKSIWNIVSESSLMWIKILPPNINKSLKHPIVINE